MWEIPPLAIIIRFSIFSVNPNLPNKAVKPLPLGIESIRKQKTTGLTKKENLCILLINKKINKIIVLKLRIDVAF